MIALAMLFQGAALSAVPAPTPQAQEMVDLFGSMCVEAALDSTKAHAFDNPRTAGRPMTPDERTRTMPGAVVSEGWIVKSPHEGWAALWFAPSKRTCGVTVRAADPKGMEAALNARLTSFYEKMGASVSQRPDELTTESGVVVHRASWIVSLLQTHELAIIASFADKPIGEHQHLMTFTFMH